MLRSITQAASRTLSIPKAQLQRQVPCLIATHPKYAVVQSQYRYSSSNSGGHDNKTGTGDGVKNDSSVDKNAKQNDKSQSNQTSLPHDDNTTVATTQESTGGSSTNKEDKLALLREEIKGLRVREKKERQSLFDMWAERAIEKEPEETREEAQLMIDQLKKEYKQVMRYQRDHLGNRVDFIDNCEMLVSGGDGFI